MSDTPDLSSILGMLNDKGIDLNGLMKNMSKNNSPSFNNPSSNNNSSSSEILNNLTFNKSSNDSNTSQNGDFQMPDMETMMKVMKLMNSINSNKESPSANLLYSLKPFLRDSKKEKVEQYVKFLRISSVLSEINKSGGDFK